MQEDFYFERKKIHIKTVKIYSEGKLSILLPDWEKENIEDLKIIGKMNSSDFKIILDMATNNKLSFIDLSETNIVSGGDNYYIKFSTKNDEFSNWLFNGCDKLEKIILPKTIEEIGEYSFSNCSNLTSLVIHSKVKNIKPGIWGGCNKLNDVKIINNSNFHFENSILYDKNYTEIIAALQTEFYGDLTIKEGIKEIQYNAFDDCKSLTSVILPSTLTKIRYSSFRASGIESIIFNENIETIGSYAFSYCYQLKEVNLIEVKIKTLEYGTFYCCNLETIYLPKLLMKMKKIVFGNNPLKNIFCYSNIPSELFDFSTEYATFNNVDIKECIVHVPEGRTNIYKKARGWRDFNSIIDDSQNFLNNIKLSDSSKNKHVKINKFLNLWKYLNL